MQKKYIHKKISLSPKQLQRVRITIVSSQYHIEISQSLEMACLTTLIKNGVLKENILVCRVPGSLEIPLAAKLIAEKKRPDAIIALGCIIKGQTYHFDVISKNCARGCQEVSLQYNIPVINEVLTCYTLKQAKERARNNQYNKGREAALTALQMIEMLKTLS